ncbi:MAG: hypothetical protein ACQETI_06045 [Halobacteriota archaeon]
MSDYVVDIKPSARRTNGAVGSLVCRRGTRRRFETREDAEAWAIGLSQGSEGRVWIRRANPADRTGADAYLVGRQGRLDLDRAYDKLRRRIRGERAGEQSELATYASAQS